MFNSANKITKMQGKFFFSLWAKLQSVHTSKNNSAETDPILSVKHSAFFFFILHKIFILQKQQMQRWQIYGF